jgi:protein-arginine kinase activator protein McsA
MFSCSLCNNPDNGSPVAYRGTKRYCASCYRAFYEAVEEVLNALANNIVGQGQDGECATPVDDLFDADTAEEAKEALRKLWEQ